MVKIRRPFVNPSKSCVSADNSGPLVPSETLTIRRDMLFLDHKDLYGKGEFC